MEMQDITKEIEGKKEDEGESEPMLEVKTEGEAEPDHYSNLQSPSEDVYTEAYYRSASVKKRAGKQTEGNTRLYRAVCVFLTVICLVLLLVILILSVKLQTGPTACLEREETTAVNKQRPLTCSYEQCQTLFPSLQPQILGCRQCADGWLTFGRSCFFLSTFRLSWDGAQRNCSARGGSLAVISSQQVQSFLTKVGNMKYWIGLRQREAAWTWVNNTALQTSYWATVTSEGDCGILSSEDPPERNWMRARCTAYSYFICQLQHCQNFI